MRDILTDLSAAVACINRNFGATIQGVRRERRSVFFFEKKTRKTFVSRNLSAAGGSRQAAGGRSNAN